MATTKKREMVFFDVEATQSLSLPGECSLLEFAAILVFPRRLVEVSSYSTLIRPGDPAAVSRRFSGDPALSAAFRAAPPFAGLLLASPSPEAAALAGVSPARSG